MKKRYIFPAILLFSSVACVVAYRIIGSEVASDGTLVEPFFLIPLSYLFFLTGIVLFIIKMIRGKK